MTHRWRLALIVGIALAGINLVLLNLANRPAPPIRATPPADPCQRFTATLTGPPPAATHHPPRFEAPARAGQRSARPWRSAVHTLYLDPAMAQLAVDAGFDTVVQVFPWRDIHPAPDRFTWGAVDAMVRTAAAYGLDLVVRLDLPPDWARREAGLPFDLAAYADFVTATAARYRGRIVGYIIWNEPNLAAEWSRSGGAGLAHWEAYAGWVADPADYLGVVGVAQARIKLVDPEALVIAGGLAPTNEVSERAVDDRAFLRAWYAAGVPACFDVLAVHDYGYGLSPEAPRAANDELNLARVETVREIMTAHHDPRPVWITELGYTVGPSESQPPVSEAEQAHYLLGAYRRVRRDWPWIGMLTVWNLSAGRPAMDEMSGYSLVRPDAAPRPAFEVLRRWHAEAGE